MIWFNKDIPVNSLLFQSKTFGLDKSRCILCRNGVHSIQYGTLNKSTIDTSLLIHNQYHIFADQLKLIFQNTCVLVLKTKVGLIFYLLTLLSWCRKICIFYIFLLFEMHKWKLRYWKMRVLNIEVCVHSLIFIIFWWLLINFVVKFLNQQLYRFTVAQANRNINYFKHD